MDKPDDQTLARAAAVARYEEFARMGFSMELRFDGDVHTLIVIPPDRGAIIGNGATFTAAVAKAFSRWKGTDDDG